MILKPASQTVLVAHELCRCFWRAGVPREVLQFVPCAGASGGARLVSSPDVDAVILTGGTDTALRMLEAKPDMHLLAETGGKNATIVTAMSDREQAIAHVLHSAFSHSGQKCSATSLLVLEAEVYDDPAFEEILCDAVRSIRVGSAWDLDTRMGPLIAPPSGDLERGLKELEESERWAVLPERREDNPHLWSPGVKWGTQPGSYTHRTEFFGPVLAVMRADNLEHAIEIVNQTGYGLTAGLESLDEREREVWLERIRAGNLYANRVTTGAVVQRQPFGGVGKSAFGPGIKAGGPSYVAQLMTFEDVPGTAAVEVEVTDSALAGLLRALRADSVADVLGADASDILAPGEAERICAAITNYAVRNAEEFGVAHDPQRLVGQDNLRRYRPVPSAARAGPRGRRSVRALCASRRGADSRLPDHRQLAARPRRKGGDTARRAHRALGRRHRVRRGERRGARPGRGHAADPTGCATRAPNACPSKCAAPSATRASTWLTHRSSPRGASNSSGTLRSRASASTTTAMEISARAPMSPANPCSRAGRKPPLRCAARLPHAGGYGYN